MWHGLWNLAVVALDQRPPFAEGEAREPEGDGELEAEQRLVEPVQGRTAQRAPVVVVEVAVRGVRVEQGGELVGEPLQDERELELAAQHLCGAQERALVRELLAILG